MREALALLGLSPSASLDDVKRAYRERMKEVHPDLHPDDPQANEKAIMLTKAFEMLTRQDVGPSIRIVWQRPSVVIRFYTGEMNTTSSGVFTW